MSRLDRACLGVYNHGKIKIRVNIMKSNTKGFIYALAAQLWWGIAPLFWHLLKDVNSFEILLHRIIWSYVLCAIIITATGKWKGFFDVFKCKKDVYTLMCSAALIAVNWGTYIYAVTNEKTVEASLAYYICSVLTVLAGAAFFHEKINKMKFTAILLAFLSIIILTVYIKTPPYIALIIAVTFLFYGVAKKLISVSNAIYITAIETMFLMPFAIAAFFIMRANGLTVFGNHMVVDIYLILSGAVTAVPLFLYNAAAQNILLSTFGYLQYINPSIVFLIGVYVFREPFDKVRFLSFILVWTAIIFYSLSYRVKSSNKALKEHHPHLRLR